MNKIEYLTPDQEQKLSRSLEEWYQWGVCTDRADRPKAETAISKMYRRIKKEPPKTFAWCESPATALIALQVLKHSIREDDLKAPLWGRFCWSLGEGLPYSFWESLRGRHRDPLWGRLGKVSRTASGRVFGVDTGILSGAVSGKVFGTASRRVSGTASGTASGTLFGAVCRTLCGTVFWTVSRSVFGTVSRRACGSNGMVNTILIGFRSICFAVTS